jgi:hypothetical protein
MASLTQTALFGDDSMASGGMGADMLNPGSASGSTDWGAVLMNGIRGAAQGAIASQVQGAYTSGQLVPNAAFSNHASISPMTLLLLGVVLYVVAKG